MEHKIYYLNDEKTARLDCFLHEASHEMPYRKECPAVVVCPGGGYSMCSDREAEPVAFQYLAAGFHAFVFRYSVGDAAKYPTPLSELCRALKLIRENAQEWHIIPDKIAVCGFSAGGHLVASLGVHWNDEQIKQISGCGNGENKPNLIILGYPVITNSYLNRGAIKRLAGDNDIEEIKAQTALQNHVSADTPPAFIFHGFADNVVPVRDSLIFAAALESKNIPVELHIYSHKYHGYSLADDVTSTAPDSVAASWMPLSIAWLKRNFYGTEPGHSDNRAVPAEGDLDGFVIS